MMQKNRTDIRLALPSKGRLSEDALELLENAGLPVHKTNPRQYMAEIPSVPGLTVLFQRAGDIVVSVRDGSVDFGITGWDVVCEGRGENGTVIPLHKTLGFGHCSLNLIVPEDWTARNVSELVSRSERVPVRVATKFPNVTKNFFNQKNFSNYRLIKAEGTLEIAPMIGYADAIVDLVSSGTTLRDNRLRILDDGKILESQAALISNSTALRTRPEVLAVARQLLEFIVAHLRARENVTVFANMRGSSPEAIADRMLEQDVLGGLQGPTISQIVNRKQGDWYAVHIVVRKDQLPRAITELRMAGGSGVIVTPVSYIFEEEPIEYKEMLLNLQ